MTHTHRPKILYGVQGQGPGPLARARLMARQFDLLDTPVDFLFSGQDSSHFTDMDVFSRRLFRKGVGFNERQGFSTRLSVIGNMARMRCASEAKSIRAERYDLIISDCEPITAWASEVSGVPSFGLGHIAALGAAESDDASAKAIGRFLQKYAPTTHPVGLDWQRTMATVMPPMIDETLEPIMSGQSCVVVYLPSVPIDELMSVLRQFPKEHFIVYSPLVTSDTQHNNVSFYQESVAGFRHHLQRASRLICHGEFDLVSTALHLGIPVLVQPMDAHLEQTANAVTLKRLKLASTTRTLSVLGLEKFLDSERGQNPHPFPNVAEALARFFLTAQASDLESLSDTLWASHEKALSVSTASRTMAA